MILADSFQGIPQDSLAAWDERYAVSKQIVMDNFHRYVRREVSQRTSWLSL